jgi:transketolase
VRAATDHVGPVFLRSSRVAMPQIYPVENTPFEIGRANVVRQGDDLAIVACGLMVGKALEAAAVLAGEGLQARVIDLHTLRPLDRETLVAAARETGAVVTAEEHLLQGGMGSNVARVISEACPVPMRFVGLADTYAEDADPDELLAKYHLTAADIAQAARMSSP